MKLFVRNVQFIVLVLLQIATLIILSTMMLTNFESQSNTDTNYGLKKEDFDRIKDAIETKNGTETLEHEIGRYHIEKRIESGTYSIRLSDELSIEVLCLIQK